jgi:hypothetical protein
MRRGSGNARFAPRRITSDRLVASQWTGAALGYGGSFLFVGFIFISTARRLRNVALVLSWFKEFNAGLLGASLARVLSLFKERQLAIANRQSGA